jgi:hypothetical protein
LGGDLELINVYAQNNLIENILYVGKCGPRNFFRNVVGSDVMIIIW